MIKQSLRNKLTSLNIKVSEKRDKAEHNTNPNKAVFNFIVEKAEELSGQGYSQGFFYFDETYQNFEIPTDQGNYSYDTETVLNMLGRKEIGFTYILDETYDEGRRFFVVWSDYGNQYNEVIKVPQDL